MELNSKSKSDRRWIHRSMEILPDICSSSSHKQIQTGLITMKGDARLKEMR
jgi:hypothetical protein